MLLMDGKVVAKHVRGEVAQEAEKFRLITGRKVHLAVVLVGDLKASQVYVKNKEKACEEVGFQSTLIELPSTISQSQLEDQILKLNHQDSVDGILVQLPLPHGLSSERVQQILDVKKDADGFTIPSLGAVLAGRELVAPCTPAGVMEILKHYHISVSGKKVCVVGRSLIVGRPLAMLMTSADATVTLCHSRSQNLAGITRESDVVVAAIGKKHFFGPEHFTKNSVVIDVGIHGSGSGGGVTGDVDFERVKDLVKAITPVPGGVGPMTIAMLLRNTLKLAKTRAGI